MSRYVLLRLGDAALLGESPLIRAADLPAFESLRGVLDALRVERGEIGADREKARRAGREEGYADGLAAGRREVRAETAARLAELAAAQAEHRRTLEAEATRLALVLLRRIAPDLDPGTLLPGLLRSALAEIEDQAPFAVRAAPRDAETLARLLAEREGRLRVVPDPDLDAGEIVIETEAGTAEAGLLSRLDALEDALEAGA